MSLIVHLAKAYPPESGGIETVTQSLARGAAAAGHAVQVVAFTFRQPGVQRQDGVDVHRHLASKLGSQPLSSHYFREGIRLARRSDVVHVHVPNVLALLMILRLGPGPRVVLHWHSDIVGKGLLGRLVAPLEQAALRRADTIVCTSPPYARHSPVLRPWQNKIRIVPIGVPPPADTRSDMPLSPRLAEFVGARRLVLAVGRLVPYKGFAGLVDAARALPPETAVVIVGAGPLQGVLQARIDSLGLGDRVLLPGHVDDADLACLFARAALFCLPSVLRSEAFGVVLLEAMSRGVPVVSSDIEGSGVPWVNAHGETGLNTPPGDVAALADACNRVLSDPDLRARLADGARRRFSRVFTEAHSIENTLAVYRDAA
jgi:glycosyltransferase involved in cell wall biosynthesis